MRRSPDTGTRRAAAAADRLETVPGPRVWTRTGPLQAAPGRRWTEHWTSADPQGLVRRAYDVAVRTGKPLDVTALKPELCDAFAERVARIAEERSRLFTSADLERVGRCPVCGSGAAGSTFVLEVYSARYHQCPACSHVFVMERPTAEALDAWYAGDRETVALYADPGTAEARMREVALPKARWMLEEYEALYGRPPRSVLDIGAGGGHFVRACRELGLEAQGLEPNHRSRAFCRQAFGFDLLEGDILEEWHRFPEVEVVTFWGVVEHVRDPMALLRTARRILEGEQGLLVFAVPRWDSFSAAVQTTWSSTVARHLDPLGHINVFTAVSAATACEGAGFAPTAAWYFGMDAFELATQLSHATGNPALTRDLAGRLPTLQACLDSARLSDEIALAGRPNVRA